MRLTYTGSTPGADSDDYALFDSTVAFPAKGQLSSCGQRRLFLDLVHSNDGTLTLYKTQDRYAVPVVWETVQVVAVTAGTDSSTYDAYIGAFSDAKLVWTNGGVAQDPWAVSLSLDSERSPA